MIKARARGQSSWGTSQGTGRRTGGKLRQLLRLGVLWVGVGAGALAADPAAADEPVMIHVRGHSQLRLSEGERRTTDGEHFQLAVHVQLDDGQQHAGAGAAGAGPEDPAGDATTDPAHMFARLNVKLRISGPDGEIGAPTVKTDSDGQAVLPLSDLSTGGYRVFAEFDGDDLRDQAEATLVIDLGRTPVSLSLEVPSQVARTGELPVEVRLQSEGQGLTARVELTVGGKRRLIQVVHGLGRDTLPLRAQPFLTKGQPLLVSASYPGDRLHTSALQQREVLLTSQARMTLEFAHPAHPAAHGGVVEIAQGSTLTAVGVVSDEDGPLADEAVDLEVSEQPGGEPADPALPVPSEPTPRLGRASASGVSDHQGRFRIVIPRLPLHPGPAVLAAAVTPRSRFILPTRAAELPLTVLPPEPVSALYYILPLLASVLGALLWLLGRWLQPHLRRLGEVLRRRLRVPAVPAVAPSSTVAEAPPVSAPGVSLAQSRRLSGLTLRRTIDTTLDGQVVDASFGRPVTGAVLELTLAAASALPSSATGSLPTIQAKTDGRFIVNQLLPGHYLVVVSAPGYLPQSFPAAIPHRGELRGVSVRLEPIRVRLLEEWRRVAQRLLGQESRLRTATPRELLEQFGRLRATALAYGATTRELRRLTELVEQAYYSPRICTPELLAEATRLADSVLNSSVTPAAALPGALPKLTGSPMPLR